jgi:hypothetical protein
VRAQAAWEVDDCPCGSQHTLSWDSWVAYERVTEGQPPTVMIATPEGSWLVPRLYIACHGLKASEVPALAKQYGWEQGP